VFTVRARDNIGNGASTTVTYTVTSSPNPTTTNPTTTNPGTTVPNP
jgi:hypothetical protein